MIIVKYIYYFNTKADYIMFYETNMGWVYITNRIYLKLEIKTKTRGDILKITPNYTIKEREEVLQVKSKESVFAIYAGLGLETTTTLEKLTPEVNLGMQNKKGDLLLLKYGVTDKSIGVSYIHRFINIKR